MSTPPTHHMNTDSRASKRTRPVSPTPESPRPPNDSAPTVTADTTPCSNANKRQNIEKPIQKQAKKNQWEFLQSDSPAPQESSGWYQPSIALNTPTHSLFPVPQLGESTWQNVSQVLKEKWPQKEGAKAWVRTYRAKHEHNAQNTVIKLKDIITKIIGESDAETLVPLPTYTFTLENFSFPDSDATNKEIAEIVKDTIHSNPDVMHQGFELESRPLQINQGNGLERLLQFPPSPPAFMLKQYFNWTNLMRTFFYISEDYGYGTARQDAQFVCMGCLCPFQKLLGWFVPSAQENKDNSNTTLDNRLMFSHGRGAFIGGNSHGGRGTTRGHTRGNTKRGRGKPN
ncbi:hypothetical protein CY34DRAFT_110588 [Suillus luteus UH-Slu-Lm8-n1]|uniref:Uncharacterized protein n=1 Tax=Suillus luteus UH-Slu-Lm8-n1 TaxID=930992 RepID=A0A0C9ZW17_9AGAM|nr:hypothetical protein CY34DRAFT_110588 [Suillus luteus UH-Slu-Lm8-n1]